MSGGVKGELMGGLLATRSGRLNWLYSVTAQSWKETVKRDAQNRSNRPVAIRNYENFRGGKLDKLTIDFNNCYGIQTLEHEFVFEPGKKKKPRAFAIYAPNGTMKTSFSRTFENLSKGELPKEERYNRTSTGVVKADNVLIAPEAIYVLKAELDISSDSPSITNILVDPSNKARYDKLLIGLDKLKSKLIKGLSRSSNIKQIDIEKTILADWQEEEFAVCVKRAQEIEVDVDLELYTYGTIFDPKAEAILQSKEFIEKALEFNLRYQELFEKEGSIYKKGVFNPNKAENSFKTLSKQGFFDGGHRVHLRGDINSIGEEELDEKLKSIHAAIDGDSDLKKIKNGLSKNAQTDELAKLIETLSVSQFEYLLENIKPENQSFLKRNIWAFNIKKLSESGLYINTYEESKEEIISIESMAASSAPIWERAVELFNDRFVDMPFSLSIVDQAKAVLGRKERAQLRFTFEDGNDKTECFRDNIETMLSQGEKRALYLLNFIFDVEERILNRRETLFILDDVADSFDYKNKHAIIQYIRDLMDTNFFHQIVLTHNFDFFRALSQGNGGFVHRERCLMTSTCAGRVTLPVADGISNYFVNKWKPEILNCRRVLYATIPFTRNLIEYTRDVKTPGPDEQDYLALTSLLHWKQDTDQITVGSYFCIYNKVFNTQYPSSSSDKAIDVLFAEAGDVCSQQTRLGLNLEDKVVLSIAIRIKAEKYLVNKLRVFKSNPAYWFQGTKDQFRGLFEEYKTLTSNSAEIRTLEKVGITVNSNIHLNSFMYEPILDLTIDHLVALYHEVAGLT